MGEGDLHKCGFRWEENQPEAVILTGVRGGDLGLQRRSEVLIYSCGLHLTLARYLETHTFHKPLDTFSKCLLCTQGTSQHAWVYQHTGITTATGSTDHILSENKGQPVQRDVFKYRVAL